MTITVAKKRIVQGPCMDDCHMRGKRTSRRLSSRTGHPCERRLGSPSDNRNNISCGRRRDPCGWQRRPSPAAVRYKSHTQRFEWNRANLSHTLATAGLETRDMGGDLFPQPVWSRRLELGTVRTRSCHRAILTADLEWATFCGFSTFPHNVHSCTYEEEEGNHGGGGESRTAVPPKVEKL